MSSIPQTPNTSVPPTTISQGKTEPKTEKKGFLSKMADKIGNDIFGFNSDDESVKQDIKRQQKRKEAIEEMKQKVNHSKNPFIRFFNGLRAYVGWVPIEEDKDDEFKYENKYANYDYQDYEEEENQPSNTPTTAPQTGLTPEQAKLNKEEQEALSKDLQEYTSLIIQLKNNQIDRLSLFNKNNVAINQPVNSQNQNNITPGSRSVLSPEEQKRLNLILKNISDLLVKTNTLRLKYQNNPDFWSEIDRFGIQKEVKEFEDIVSSYQSNNQTLPAQPIPTSAVTNQSSSVQGSNGSTQPTQTAFSPVVTSQTTQQLPNTNGSAQTNINPVPPIPSQILQPKTPDQQGQQPVTPNFEIKEIKKFHEQMQRLSEYSDALYQQMDLFVNNPNDPNRLTTLQQYLQSIYLSWLPVRDDFRGSILGYMNYLQTEGVTNENLDQRNKLTNQIWQAKEDIEKLLVHSTVEYYNILQFSNILIIAKQFKNGYNNLLNITQELDKITNDIPVISTSNKLPLPKGPIQGDNPIPQEEEKEPVINRRITTLDGVGKVIEVQLGVKKKDLIANNNQNLTQNQKVLLAFRERKIKRITTELENLSQIIADNNASSDAEQVFDALLICKDLIKDNELDANLSDKVDKYLYYLNDVDNSNQAKQEFYDLADNISDGAGDIEASYKAVALAMLINNQNLALNGAKDNFANWTKVHSDDPNNTDWINSEWEKSEAILQAFFDNTRDAIARKIILAEITAKFENEEDKNGYGLRTKFKEVLGYEVKAMQIEEIYKKRAELFASFPDEKKHALGILFQEVGKLISKQINKIDNQL